MNPVKKKIVITGAPSSGKSTTIARISEILGSKATIVPEGAFVLLSGGFPAPEHHDMQQIESFQKAIIQVQTGLEIIFDKKNPDAQLMIFDRGILDGAGFWPPGPQDYYDKFKIDVAKEYAKYDYVFFFGFPSEKFFGGLNSLRFHNYEQCLASEKMLKQIWHKHPNFIEVKATENFEDKIQTAISTIQKIVND
jgi:hypothetical protein